MGIAVFASTTLLVVIDASAAGHRAVVPETGFKSVKPGGGASFNLAFPSQRECSASFAGRTLGLDTLKFDQMELRIRTSRRAMPGRYEVTISCHNAVPARFAVKVRPGHNPGRRFAIPGVRFSIHHKIWRLPTAEEAAAIARNRWLREGPDILQGFRSGQCTDWAAQKRPDVIQLVFEATVVAELLHQKSPPQLGDAQEWPVAAAAVGLTVSERPQQGALVAWQEGVEDANSKTGHIGYVESIATDGLSFSTSEMNFGSPYKMGYRDLLSTPVDGRSFIWP